MPGADGVVDPGVHADLTENGVHPDAEAAADRGGHGRLEGPLLAGRQLLARLDLAEEFADGPRFDLEGVELRLEVGLPVLDLPEQVLLVVLLRRAAARLATAWLLRPASRSRSAICSSRVTRISSALASTWCRSRSASSLRATK